MFKRNPRTGIAMMVLMARFLVLLLSLAAVAAAEDPVPLINQPLVPDAVKPGAAGFTLTVSGTGFVSGSVVHWNGSPRTTTFVSTSRLKATILATDIAKPATASVAVVNPAPGGGTSNEVFFAVARPISVVSLRTTSFAAGSGLLTSLAIGDFNRDGKADLAITDANSGTVSILLGNGNGTFQPAVNYSTGGANSVATGDFNGDGKLDLAVATAGESVSILLGNGDGTFQVPASYSTGSGSAPFSVAVGDFNRDGKLDLAVANYRGADVTVLLGNGDGTFQAPASYSTGSGSAPLSVAVGDFNRDGKLDLVVGKFTCPNNPCGNLSVLLGNGDGTFQAGVDYNAGFEPTSVAVADFNNDGKLDLAVADISSAHVNILLGNGDGTFQASVNYNAGADPVSVAIGDLNGDGKLDLAVENIGSSYVSILLGNGDGTFQSAENYSFGSSSSSDATGSVGIGDFDRDGGLDLAVAAPGSTGVYVLLQAPTASLSKTKLQFGGQVLGTSSVTQQVTLTSSGYLTLNIAGISISGTNATDFSQTNTCLSSLPVGAHCTISVTFKPTHVGPRTGSVTITDNAPGSPQFIALAGVGVISGPDATVTPTNLTFATQLVGTTSSAQSATLTNYGTTMLDITSIMASGDFSQSHTCGSSLAPEASCTISTTFKPTRSGTRTGAVSITDNAPGSPQKVSLTGTGTVVEFNPTSLAFHCHNIPNTCPPPPQTTTLTNTGNTTLSISSITITGSTAFSQTHTCGSSVVAKGSCTITVAFKSSSRGTFSGAVSVSDNGGGSPQQVPLSASETKRGAGALAVRSAMGAHITASVPAPTGPMHVGTRIMDLVDSRRNDPYLADGAKRELLVRFWYPASLDQGCEPAEYTSPTVWNYFSQLAEFPLPEVKTNSCQDAPARGGAHPVIVFTHGYTGTFTDYTFLFEDLASRGYVVASVDHTYEATAVAFPDGRFLKSIMGSHLANTWQTDDQSLSLAVKVRLGDLKFVLNELEHLNASSGNPFAGKLDMTRVALAGHSLGGLTTWLGVQHDLRFKAAILLDPYWISGSYRPTEKPVMLMTMGREERSQDECQLWRDLHGPRFSVNLRGTEHLTPSDAIWLAKGAIKTGAMGPDRTIAAIRDYVAAFLDENLQGRPADRLLRGTSDYPDVVVTTGEQTACVSH